MKSLAVAALFVASLGSVLSAARVEALASPRIEARLARPVALPQAKDGGTDKDDEKDEEEHRALGAHASLELVDPGLSEDVLRLRFAALKF